MFDLNNPVGALNFLFNEIEEKMPTVREDRSKITHAMRTLSQVLAQPKKPAAPKEEAEQEPEHVPEGDE